MKKNVFLIFTAIVLSTAGLFLVSKNAPFEENERNEGRARAASAAFWKSLKANKQTGIFDETYYNKAVVEAQALAQANTKSFNLEWKELGPHNIGGRTRAILIDKNNPNHMLAGGVSGGLWVSNDGASTWKKHPQSDALENMNITAIAQSSGGDIYFGTGELIGSTEIAVSNGGFVGGLGFPGYGVWKSTDNGTTFTHLSSTTPTGTGTNNQWQYIDAIACDNVDNNIIYVATHKGLYMTSNGGTSFAKPTGATSSGWCTDVKVAGNGDVITFFGDPSLSGNGANAFVSQDHGTSFTGHPIKSGTTFQRVKFAYAPSDNNVIYAGAIKVNGTGDNVNGGVFRSADAGTTWTQVGVGASSGFDIYNQVVYTMSLAVKPDNKDVLYTGGLDLWRYTHANGNWKKVSNSFSSNTSLVYLHADHHALAFHPNNPNQFYVGGDGGVFVCNNASSETPHFADRNKGYGTLQAYGIGVGPKGAVIEGAQDNGTSYNDYTGNYPTYFTDVKGGDGFQCAISHFNDRALFGTTYGDDASINDHVGRSLNGGLSFAGMWDEHIDANSDDYPDDGGFFVTRIYLWENYNANLTGLDLTNRSRLYYAASNNVWVAPQALATAPKWYRLTNPGIVNNAFCFEGTKDGNIVYVGTEGGAIYRIKGLNVDYPINYTGNFLATTSGAGVTTTKIFQEASSRTVTGIAVDPNNDNNLIVSLANYGATSYVVKLDSAATTTSTRTPINITGNLPKWPVYDVVINPANRAQAFVGTEQGVYSTANVWAGTVTWEDENATFPRATTMDLQFQKVGVTKLVDTTTITTYNWYLFAGTHGRGLFYTNTLCGSCDTISTNLGPSLGQNSLVNLDNELQVYPNPTSSNFDLKIPAALANNAQVQIYNLKGQLMYNQKIQANTLKINAQNWPSGTYLVQAKAGNQTKSLKIVKQ